MRAWALLVAVLLMFGLQRADTPEQTPEGYDHLQLAQGWREKILPTVAAVDAACRAAGANAHDEFNKRLIVACANPRDQTIYLPGTRENDPEWMAVTRDHERLHALGAVHAENGKGWANLPDLASIHAALSAPPQAATATPQHRLAKAILGPPS